MSKIKEEKHNCTPEKSRAGKKPTLCLGWLAGAFCGICCAPVLAQQSEVPVGVENSAWTYDVGLYGFIPISVEGTSTVDGGAVDLDLGPSEIFNLLQFAIAGRFEGWKMTGAGDGSAFGFVIDGQWVNLGLDESSIGPGAAGTVNADIRQGIVDIMAGYRLPHINTDQARGRYTQIDLMGGMRYNYLRQEIDVTPGLPAPFTANLGGSRDWVSPVIGVRATWVFNDSWSAIFRGDMSGFGVSGEDLSWSLTALAGYDFGDSKTFYFGYRVYDIEYSDGSGAEEFALDMTQHGPFLGLSWKF